LNNQSVKVYDSNSDGTRTLNEAATEEARIKTVALRTAFGGDAEQGIEGWVFKDDERRVRLEDIYNETHNRYVKRDVNGAHLTLPGLAKAITLSNGETVPFTLRSHQKDAVWRVVQTGNTLLDHVVGAGKTFTMIAAGM